MRTNVSSIITSFTKTENLGNQFYDKSSIKQVIIIFTFSINKKGMLDTAPLKQPTD